MKTTYLPREPSASLPGRLAWILIWVLGVPLPTLIILYLLLGR
ncbi:hypothetical protein SAMN02745166_02289 [Prosthecobacter debontii]|uniref:Uncharacterized protein n=1 Tax=Prosthecobacter debontii TaxID=48467 RepID=A0A1T4Y016_9BACT|nr:hypothetical protein [Prosthecobacter debontii]SKA95139.1 hypothetical protein SAMN02745166_02289 [Prosthecobacter debontii]